MERLFDEAAVQFLNAKKGQSAYSVKVQHIAYWRTIFGGRPLSSLTSDAIMDNLPTHFVRHGTKVQRETSQSTKNRYLATIRTMLNMAVEMRWIPYSPMIKNYREPAVRVKFLTRDQARALIPAISQQWLRDICRFALATGLRCGEILSLKWEHIDIPRASAWVDAGNAKSFTSRSVPLNAEALAVLESRRRSLDFVFTRTPGLALNAIDAPMLKRAFDEIGVKNFRFHDLRHTWASWHVQSGTPLFVLKELGGWKTLEMVKKYAHLAPEHLSPYANAVMFWSEQPESGEKEAPRRVA